jgi:hypothetical protein
MKRKKTAILLTAILVITGVSFVVNQRLPPTGLNLTGTWKTAPNLGGSVFELSHTRSGLRGNGYHLSDDGGLKTFTVNGAVAGQTVHLVLIREPHVEEPVNETNSYVINQSADWGVYLVDERWTDSRGTNQSPQWSDLTSLYRGWDELLNEIHNKKVDASSNRASAL